MKILGASIERELPYEKELVLRFVAAPAMIVNWHPWIEKVSIFEEQGLQFRRSEISGGNSELIEKYWQDEDGDEFHYQVVRGLWSDFRYRSKISVETCKGGSLVSWQGRLMTNKPDDEVEQMEAFFEEGLNGLEVFLADL
ncbi:hypothetical protein [Pelagicoccus sp. SDUM812002]|uniref:hypothetical protein n=1 Tax=Pelagicoccus sp. SDUM812002 TaxID=3041266 RepID=UPI00280DD701|nr:hypothetical protein [Pelagicoccus sp. SDUM812002]MDQ8184430.1 hypothetical protein [Pelagicoccus sp. SDUM812002]